MSVEISPQTKEVLLPAIDGVRTLETPTSSRIVFLPKKLNEIEKICQGFGGQEYLLNRIYETDLLLKAMKSRNGRYGESYETEKQALGELRAMFIAVSALGSLRDTKEAILASNPEISITVIRTHHPYWMQFGEYPTRFFFEIFLPGEEAVKLRERALENLKEGKKVILSSAF